jgi:RNA-directed DNA polymerase
MWSSQHYIKLGTELGHPLDLLENAVDQIECVIDPAPHPPAILSLGHLASRAEVPYASLRRIITREEAVYRHFPVRKRAGGVRIISIPEPHLMKVQRWLSRYVLNLVPAHQSSSAFHPGSSIVACATKHCGAEWLVKLDVSGFFSSISELQVYRVFRSLNYQPLVAFELARLCTFAPESSPRYLKANWQNWHKEGVEPYRYRGQGFLPQGAPTSPMLSNLAMRNIDSDLTDISKTYGLRYTRYSDDMTFSTRKKTLTRATAMSLIYEVRNRIMSAGLRLNRGKTVIVPPGSRKVVLGLLVDGPTPALPREFRMNLKQHLHFLEKHGPVEHAKARNFDTVWGMRRHVRGLIDYATMVDQSYGIKMLHRFESVTWP